MSDRVEVEGLLIKTGNGEEDDLLGFVDSTSTSRILTEYLQNKVRGDRQVTVRYWTADAKPESWEAETVRQLSGTAEIDYGMRYSEITGYLWTDEAFKIGGHDLIGELTSHIGRYFRLQIDVHG